MIELIIIKYILNNNIYNKYNNYINLTNKELVKIYYIIKQLHEASDEDFTVDDLELKFFSEYPFLKSSEKEMFSGIFEQLRKVHADEARVEEFMKKQRDMVQAHRIAELSLEVTEGRKEFIDLLSHVSTLEADAPVEEEIEFVSDDLEELYNNLVVTQGLRWRLPCLNKALGSLRKGDFGFVFARPETGKTSFLASEATYMAEQTDRPILWFNNEEQGEKVMMRCVQASLGMTEGEYKNDLKKYRQAFHDKTKRNIKIVDNASIHKTYVEKVCKAIEPSLIIFDQIDKIKGFDESRTDLTLGAIYQWARELAKTYAPVIAVCQADGTGEGVKWLTMGHVANAKTSKQAEADWILGIGKSNQEGLEYVRHLNISKNKLVGDEDSIPELRHGKMDVIIKPEVARYEDV
jgi:KaiC/GvpD/RAD55 family RecA-like ATPase